MMLFLFYQKCKVDYKSILNLKSKIYIYIILKNYKSIKNFEYTPELIIFDLLGIDLVHGWIVDPGIII